MFAMVLKLVATIYERSQYKSIGLVSCGPMTTGDLNGLSWTTATCRH